VLDLPPKIPYYSSLFLVANARRQVIGKDVLDFTVAKIKELLEQGDMVKAKLMLRFFAGLGRIVEENGIMNVINEIISKFEQKVPTVLLLWTS
jgi:Na+/H+ antiporter NhaC